MTLDLRAGAVIGGKLRLLRPLGQGGMGVVWAARHEALDTDVAVKLIRPERVAADPALVTRFEIEARATARIAHPHVVKVMDYGTLDGTVPFIVMELLEGFTLAELLEQGGRLSLATTLVLLQQVGGALGTAHERGVVHRDIKPHNVFLLAASPDYPVFAKVLDFGIAKLLGETQVPGASHALTETGAIIGSPPYMSPEQIEGSKHVDLRSDLWSLGVILYEALTGRRPFGGGSFVAVGSAVLEGKYPPPSTLRAGLPGDIDDFFAKALAVDPDGRFASAREMVDAFQALGLETEVDIVRVTSDTALDVGLASTLDASAPERPAPAALTLSHAPVALKKRSLSRRRVVVLTALVASGIAAAFALSAAGGARGALVCPAGMQRIDAAKFRMGSAAEGNTPGDELPAHEVKLQAFCLDATEVTLGAYRACASCSSLATSPVGEELTPNGVTLYSQFCNRPERTDHPVNCIEWQSANAYCEAVGKRLPTEAEWEFAARGEGSSTYPWGEAAPSGERLNACDGECSRLLTAERAKFEGQPYPKMYADDDGDPSTAAVGSRKLGATPQGVFDLAGNVWEWTSSHYCPYSEPECGDSRRVIRGGGWDTVESRDVRAARRKASAPSARSWAVGFRCAKSL